MTDQTPRIELIDLIQAEQDRARRLHPDDHAGHPDVSGWGNLMILSAEVREVRGEMIARRSGITLAWELVQVTAVAAAWAQRVIDDADINPDDLMALIEADHRLGGDAA